jgi:transcription initiation factor TFIIIB Brf1 subunit/transcription initiation factor TFIIB
MSNKDLDIAGCRTFICPNMNLLEKWAKRLELSDLVIVKAKTMSNEYIKRTYHNPKYASIKPVIAACIYIASIIWNEKRTQKEIRNVSNVSYRSIGKWYITIYDELCKKREDLYGKKIDFWKDVGALDAMKGNSTQFDLSSK